MFDIGLPEFAVLALVALFVFGPDRLPDVARQAGKFVRQLKQLATSARTQISEELGPEFADLDLKDLNPRALVQKHLLDDVEAEPKPRRGHRPLEEGESAPFDPDAT
jgi:sec-independent protein translocase protein TatB